MKAIGASMMLIGLICIFVGVIGAAMFHPIWFSLLAGGLAMGWIGSDFVGDGNE